MIECQYYFFSTSLRLSAKKLKTEEEETTIKRVKETSKEKTVEPANNPISSKANTRNIKKAR